MSTQDVLKVRTFPDRVLIELDEETGTRFIVLDPDGMRLHTAAERIELGWPEARQIRDLITSADKLWGKRPSTKSS